MRINKENRKNNNRDIKINLDYKDNEKTSITVWILFIISISIAFLLTYFMITKLAELEEQNNQKNRIKQEEIKRAKQYQRENYAKQQNKDYQRERIIQQQKNSIRLDNNIYSDNLYSIQFDLHRYYRDSEFVRNLEPFFNNLTNIYLPKNDKIYEFEIKGTISQTGKFRFIVYKRTHIKNYDNEIIKELNRLKTIQFREQSKDVHFYLTVTNKYKLIR